MVHPDYHSADFTEVADLIGRGRAMDKDDLLKEYRQSTTNDKHLAYLQSLEFSEIMVAEDGSLQLI